VVLLIKQSTGIELLSSLWFPYTVIIINLIIIWFMPKRLTQKEIYITWMTITAINLSTDIIFDLYFNLYHFVGGGKVHLSVHIVEWTLGPSNAIIFLNFMPPIWRVFMFYLITWIAYSLLFEAFSLHFHFLSYTGWKLWYSAPVYLLVFLFLRWHLRFVRAKK
jgi:hypothetical protein